MKSPVVQISFVDEVSALVSVAEKCITDNADKKKTEKAHARYQHWHERKTEKWNKSNRAQTRSFSSPHSEWSAHVNHSPVNIARPNNGENITYIQSLKARMRSTQQSAIKRTEKKKVTITAKPNCRRIWVRFLIHVLESATLPSSLTVHVSLRFTIVVLWILKYCTHRP